MKKWIIVAIMIAFEAYAQSPDTPTIVEAIANTADGNKNIAIVTQPNNQENPLGNPIVGPYIAPKLYNTADSIPDETNNSSSITNETKAETVSPQENQNLGKQFKNTLMEANGEIYDIQSYPAQDIKAIENSADPQTIYSPNVNQ